MNTRKSAIFGVTVGRTNFTDHHASDTINGLRGSVLLCKMHDCHCTIRKKIRAFPFLPISLSHQVKETLPKIKTHFASIIIFTPGKIRYYNMGIIIFRIEILSYKKLMHYVYISTFYTLHECAQVL